MSVYVGVGVGVDTGGSAWECPGAKGAVIYSLNIVKVTIESVW